MYLNYYIQQLRMLIYTVPVMLIAITVHEFAHGWVSYKLGDPTPKYEGRLSLNPLRHLDLIGTLCLLFFHMGWAKPVRINTAYYRNKRQGIIWVSLAGPVANFLTAFLSLLICGALMRFGNSGNSAVSIGIMLCYYSAVLNIGLGVFNLIPIPPLDGSNVVEQMYPRVFYFYQRIRPYCTLILLILLVTGVLSRPLSVANNGIFAAIKTIKCSKQRNLCCHVEHCQHDFLSGNRGKFRRRNIFRRRIYLIFKGYFIQGREHLFTLDFLFSSCS